MNFDLIDTKGFFLIFTAWFLKFVLARTHLKTIAFKIKKISVTQFITLI